MTDTIELVWCGARKGGRSINPDGGSGSPAAEWTMVASSASPRSSEGNNPGRRDASIVLPEPGGPTNST